MPDDGSSVIIPDWLAVKLRARAPDELIGATLNRLVYRALVDWCDVTPPRIAAEVTREPDPAETQETER